MKKRDALRKVLAEQPAQPSQQDIPDILAGALGVSRGTAYQLMREALALAEPQDPVGYLYEGIEYHTKGTRQFSENKFAIWRLDGGGLLARYTPPPQPQPPSASR